MKEKKPENKHTNNIALVAIVAIVMMMSLNNNTKEELVIVNADDNMAGEAIFGLDINYLEICYEYCLYNKGETNNDCEKTCRKVFDK